MIDSVTCSQYVSRPEPEGPVYQLQQVWRSAGGDEELDSSFIPSLQKKERRLSDHQGLWTRLSWRPEP